jgi:hypothetical protein
MQLAASEWSDKAPIVIQIVGTTLALSAFFDRQRLARWESALRAYLRARRILALFVRVLQPVLYAVFNVFAIPFRIIAYTVTMVLMAILRHLFYTLFLLPFFLVVYLAKGLIGKTASDVLAWVFVALLFIWRYVTIYFDTMYPDLVTYRDKLWETHVTIAIRIAEASTSVAESCAALLAFILYAPVILSISAAYLGTVFLLTPYLVCDKIAGRFNMRPVLGVLGVMLTLVGLFIQLLS